MGMTRQFGNVTAGACLLLAIAATVASGFAHSQPAQETGIYIAADKRHQSVSRFDLFPFTDRPKGDPDRYRAVNPNYVKKQDGYYYFLLDAQPGTHCYDENLKDKGPLTETTVPVDLGRTKEAKGSDGKTVRYVYAQNRGYVPRNNLTPAADIRTGKWFSFPLKTGKHPLFDGTGITRGVVAARSVRLNYGQQKDINGERCYYAFSTSIIPDGSTQRRGASGWIKASALQDGNAPQYSAEVVTKMQPPSIPATETTFTEYEMTGGDPEEKTGTDANGKPVYRYGYADASGRFISYKVLPGVALNGRSSIAATDYLKRSDDVINLGFNVAGVSSDTYRVSSAQRPLTFHRAADPHATVIIDLFYPKDATHDGKQPVAKMVFVYGYVDEGSGAKRWGWIPLSALKPKPAR
jgi:hypothetical protein